MWVAVTGLGWAGLSWWRDGATVGEWRVRGGNASALSLRLRTLVYDFVVYGFIDTL